MRKCLLVCAVALFLPFVLVACGGEEPPDDPIVDNGPTAPPNEPWYPEDDDPGGAPSGGSIFDPCSRAACWDGDRRSWIINPPWDDDIVDPPISPETPEQQGGLPAKKPPVMNGGQQH